MQKVLIFRVQTKNRNENNAKKIPQITIYIKSNFKMFLFARIMIIIGHIVEIVE